MVVYWWGIGLLFRPCRGTYDYYLSNTLPPVDTDKFRDLVTLHDLVKYYDIFGHKSPTACYFDINLRTGQFYCDQQDRIVWRLIMGQVISFDENGRNLGIVAGSLTEFITRIEIENSIWFKVGDKFDGLKINIWQYLMGKLDQKEIEYLLSYYQKY